MDDEAVRIADEIEKALTQRISAVYGDALKKAIRMNRRFLQKIPGIDPRLHWQYFVSWNQLR